jgi:hypothetical protein
VHGLWPPKRSHDAGTIFDIYVYFIATDNDNMRSLILCTIILLSYGFSQRTIINDPKLSLRCQNLLKERREKIKLTQRTRALIERTDSLIKKHSYSRREAPKQKALIAKRQLNHNLELFSLKVKNIEENIIRSGCPGVPL